MYERKTVDRYIMMKHTSEGWLYHYVSDNLNDVQKQYDEIENIYKHMYKIIKKRVAIEDANDYPYEPF